MKYILKAGVWLFLWWYRLTQWVTGLRHTMPVAMVTSMMSLPVRIGGGTRYKFDMLGLDFFCHPRRVQYRVNKGVDLGDCEDHAGYWLSVLFKSDMIRSGWLGIVHMRDRKTGKRAGHCVAIFEDFIGDIFFADYTEPTRVLDVSLKPVPMQTTKTAKDLGGRVAFYAEGMSAGPAVDWRIPGRLDKVHWTWADAVGDRYGADVTWATEIKVPGLTKNDALRFGGVRALWIGRR